MSEDIKKQCEELTDFAKADVQKAIAESGMTQAVWCISKEGRQMLGEWAIIQEEVKEHYGIELPSLLEGVTVNLVD